MQLHGLARELLSAIWSRLEFSDILMLHECGDRSLATAMQRSPPEKVLLVSEIRFMYRRLPSLLSNFAASITHFELRTLACLAEHPQDTQRAIRSLSPNLRALILHNPEAELFLVATDPVELEDLRRTHAATTRALGFTRPPKMIDLSKLFPNLRHLTIEHSEESMTFESVDLCVLKSLPLTDLNFRDNYLIDHHVLNFLPDTLESLSLGCIVKLAIRPRSRFLLI